MKAIRLHSSTGSSVESQWAQAADGAWWARYRDRHPRFGWRWTKWRPSDPAPAPGHHDIDYGCVGYGSDPVHDGHLRVRLPG